MLKISQLISKVHVFFDTSIPIRISIRTCHDIVGLVLTLLKLSVKSQKARVSTLCSSKTQGAVRNTGWGANKGKKNTRRNSVWCISEFHPVFFFTRAFEREERNGIPSTYITSSALNEKLRIPRTLNSKPWIMNLNPIHKIWHKSKYPLQLQQLKLNI